MSPAGSLAGMDLEQVRDLARTMRRNAEHLDSVRHQLDATVRTLAWRGPDADALRHTWESSGRQALAGTAADLHRMSTALLGEVDQQATASDEHGGSGHGGPGPLGGHRPDPLGGLLSGIRHSADRAAHQAVSWTSGGIVRGATQGVKLWQAGFEGAENLVHGFDVARDGIAGLSVAAVTWPVLAVAAERSGKPLPSFSQQVAIGALAAATVQGRDLERRVTVTSRSITPPGNVASTSGGPAMMALVNQAYDAGKDEDHVIVTRLADGRYVVAIPGTQDWGGESGHVFDQGNNLRLMANLPSSATDAVRQAMDRADIPRGADITLVGHSQGGIAAVRLLDDPSFTARYPVARVATFGSPIDGMPVHGVPVLSVTNGSDLVPKLDLGQNPQPGVTTVHLDDSAWVVHAHTNYDERLADQRAAPIDSFVASMGGLDLTGATQVDSTLHRSRTPSPVGAL